MKVSDIFVYLLKLYSMKKIALGITAVALLAIGYYCFFCCPPDCCKAKTECTKNTATTDETATIYKMKQIGSDMLAACSKSQKGYQKATTSKISVEKPIFEIAAS